MAHKELNTVDGSWMFIYSIKSKLNIFQGISVNIRCKAYRTVLSNQSLLENNFTAIIVCGCRGNGNVVVIAEITGNNMIFVF